MQLQSCQLCAEKIGKAFKPNERVTILDVMRRLRMDGYAWEIICRGLLPNNFMGYASAEKFCFSFRRDIVIGPRMFHAFLKEINKWRRETV